MRSALLFLAVAAHCAPATVIGVVTEQHRRECEAATESWVDPHLEVGFTEVVGGDAVLRPHLGKPVVVVADVFPRPPSFPTSEADCPQYQMRSDMVVAKGGMRVQRVQSARRYSIAAKSATPLEGMSATRHGDEVEVVFRNPLDTPLQQVALVVHYEGCYGKPGVTHQRKVFPVLAPGAEAKARFPAYEKAHRGRGTDPVHRLDDLTVTATTPRVIFDLTRGVAALGALVACPDRAKRKAPRLP